MVDCRRHDRQSRKTKAMSEKPQKERERERERERKRERERGMLNDLFETMRPKPKLINH